MNASCTTSSASWSLRVSQRARLYAASMCGRTLFSKRARRLIAGDPSGKDRRSGHFIPGNIPALCPVLQASRPTKGESMKVDRREFLKLTALGGGAVFASALPGCASMAGGATDEFYFVQLSDSHWGFNGPAVNPDARGTLPKAIEAVNALPVQPDFIVFTGDLTHTTDDPQERRRRLAEFKEVVKAPKNQNIHSMASEHDASLGRGEAR